MTHQIKTAFQKVLFSVLIAPLFSSGSVWAAYCETDTNQNHVSAGRAETYTYGVYARATGSGDELGFHYSDSSTLEEVSPGFYRAVSLCSITGNSQPTAPYPNASELNAADVINEQGNYGVAVTGGHLVDSTTGDIPWENKVSTSGTVNIPAGSSIKYAFLYYSGAIALEGGDFTEDNLNNLTDIENNGISFHIGNTHYGPFDTRARKPSGETHVGSETQLLPATIFEFGTLTDTATSFWGNRLDITGQITDRTSDFTITVDAPENIDISANNANENGGNLAGYTEFNNCSSVMNWSIVVIYEHSSQPRQQIILKDEIVRAWDYTFVHKGVWERPFVTFEHAPIQHGTKFYTYAANGIKAKKELPSFPACTCGCGGQYNLQKTDDAAGDPASQYWSNTLVDPAEVEGDPMNRDKNTGPWSLVSDGANSINGNDWTLFRSGSTFTEFPNLYEGENVSEDTIQPITNENSGTVTGDTYDGHPWGGRGDVTYHGWGNSTSIVEVALNNNAITEGETETTVYFKGDQKDVFKPQSRVTLRYLLLTIPLPEVEGGSAAPVINLESGSSVTYTEGSTYSETGYTATDDVDGNLTAAVSVNCNFDTAIALTTGTYQCTYSVTDTHDNTTEVTRTITVEPIIQEASCVTSTLNTHELEARAYSSYFSYYATGSDLYLGSTFLDADVIKSLEETTLGNWSEVPSCP